MWITQKFFYKKIFEKFEARNSKSETNSKFKLLKFETRRSV